VPIFHLTFHYQSRGERIVGRAVVNADTLEAAARRVAAARGLSLSSVFVRTVTVERKALDLSGVRTEMALLPAVAALQARLTSAN
jgi:hypothetical protein